MYRSLEPYLLQWKTGNIRYPLLLRGARQVGKTYLIEKFGKEHFDGFVSINFEAQPEAAACFASLDPFEITMRLEAILGIRIKTGVTLLFLDEIQACPQAILSLRYFKERLPDLHVIGAGSLLEFALVQEKFSFPVGRVQFLYMKPLSFKEYLLARDQGHLCEMLNNCTLASKPTEDQHETLIKYLKEYLLIGGMPAAVGAFCQFNSLADITLIQEVLLGTYRADFSKYASIPEQRYLKLLFDGIPQMVGQQFKYSKIDPHIRSRELKTGLDYLEWAGLITPIFTSSASGIPLSFQAKRQSFKYLFLDVGLLQRQLQVEAEAIFTMQLSQINSGALAEQFVGQELLAYQEPQKNEGLFYWQRDKAGSDAEVDYVIENKGEIVPLEVKAGPTGKLKSLQQFMKEKNSKLGLKISQSQLQYKHGILSLPFYLIEQLPRLVEEALATEI